MEIFFTGIFLSALQVIAVVFLLISIAIMVKGILGVYQEYKNGKKVSILYLGFMSIPLIISIVVLTTTWVLTGVTDAREREKIKQQEQVDIYHDVNFKSPEQLHRERLLERQTTKEAFHKNMHEAKQTQNERNAEYVETILKEGK